MYRIKTLNKISSVGLSKLDQDRFQVGSDVEQEDGILVRSGRGQGPTTSPSTAVPSAGSWSSTPPAPTPTQ